MRYIVTCHICDEHASDWLEDYDLAIVDLTARYANHLLDLRRLAQPLMKQSRFCAVELFDYTPEPFAMPSDDDDSQPPPELADLYESGDGAVPCPENFQPSSDFRMDCCTVRVQEEGIMYHFCPKHSDVHVETAVIPWPQIEKAATEAHASEGRRRRHRATKR